MARLRGELPGGEQTLANCPPWVNYGLSRPTAVRSAPGGKADLIRRKADIAAERSAEAGLFFGGHRLSVIMYMAVPTVTREVSMNFLQDRRVLWGGAVIIVLIVLAVVYGWPGVWPGGETPPAQ